MSSEKPKVFPASKIRLTTNSPDRQTHESRRIPLSNSGREAQMTRKFRKRFGTLENWHFHANCPDWPLAEYIDQTEKPAEEQLCIRCLILGESEHRGSKKQPQRAS